eukprot:scaffold25697_cov72-Amphora_coffeaeformis.AAC.1
MALSGADTNRAGTEPSLTDPKVAARASCAGCPAPRACYEATPPAAVSEPLRTRSGSYKDEPQLPPPLCACI